MYLRDVLKDFSKRQITRLKLPNVTALEAACSKFQAKEVLTENAEERIRRILGSFSVRNAASLNYRDLRFITAAIGNNGLIGKLEVAYILSEIERRDDPRLLRGVFNALLAAYRDKALRSQIRTFVAGHLEVLRPDVSSFCHQSRILEDDAHLQQLANEIALSSDPYTFCITKEINARILGSNYGTQLKLAAIREAVKSPNEQLLRKLIEWIFSGVRGTPIGDYYEAMLAPFESTMPHSDVQKLLISKLVEKFRDPRIHSWPNLSGNNGDTRREKCIATIRRWLSIEYLDLFIQIIERTAVDRQFRPRKAFWMQYFEKDKISDVTLVLASDADSAARRTRSRMVNAEYMQWAKLGSALSDQSVLLMQLGDLIIAEWSHSGAIRFWRADAKSAPKFHLPEYLGYQLRRGSLKIKVGHGFRDAITHHENGQWMRWASDAIKYHTGVSV
jgi:hypothetical protein